MRQEWLTIFLAVHVPRHGRHYDWSALTELSYAGAVSVLPNGTLQLGCVDPRQKERDAEYTVLHSLARANGVRLTHSVGGFGTNDERVTPTQDPLHCPCACRNGYIMTLAR